VTGDMKSWGRFATLGLGFVALLAGQMAALATLTWWYRLGLSQLPKFDGDGVVVTLIIAVSTPVEVMLLALFAQRTGESAADYLGWIWPRRSHVVFGITAIVVFIVVGNAGSWLLGRDIVTTFQTDITATALAAGWLPLLILAVVVATPIGEETLFRGFLFRGWIKSSHDTWPVIGATALLFALMHVQYDWFVIAQVFAFGLLLGWMRWATGSSILTMLLHGLINAEGMLETFVSLHR
jgi:membrane protease YdiL (CAAX protease family)